MKRIKRRYLVLLGLVALLGLLLGSATPALAKPIPANDLKKVTLIHYAAGDRFFAKKAPVTPPLPVNTYYELLGWKWAELPVQFALDPDGGPTGASAEMLQGLDTWDAATSAKLFADVLTVDSSTNPSLNAADGVNTISFRLLAGYPTALAITNIWYDPDSDLMVDTDVIFNAKYKWGIDADGEGAAFSLPRSTYDVCNIATHEIGHVVGLDDLYLSEYRELTMYGYSAAKETKKISLMPGDIAGTQAIYGN